MRTLNEIPLAAEYTGKALFTSPLWTLTLGLLSGALEYFLPGDQVKHVALALLGATLLDFASGIVASKASNVEIKSSKMSRTCIKLFGYCATAGVIGLLINQVPDSDKVHAAF